MALDLTPLNSLIKTDYVHVGLTHLVQQPILILTEFPDGGLYFCSVANFQEIFASVPELTHADLSAHPAAKVGWQAIFDDWKSKGLIS